MNDQHLSGMYLRDVDNLEGQAIVEDLFVRMAPLTLATCVMTSSRFLWLFATPVKVKVEKSQPRKLFHLIELCFFFL